MKPLGIYRGELWIIADWSTKAIANHFLTFRFSAGIDAVRARCGFVSAPPDFVTAGVLTSIVFRLKMFGDLLRVYLSRLSSLCEVIGKRLENYWESASRASRWKVDKACSSRRSQNGTGMWFKSINVRITTRIDAFTGPSVRAGLCSSHISERTRRRTCKSTTYAFDVEQRKEDQSSSASCDLTGRQHQSHSLLTRSL